MTNPTHPASGEALSATPSPDKLRRAIEALERAESVLANTAVNNALRTVVAADIIDAALSALKGEGA